MERRKFLKTGTLGIAAVVAGCGGNSSNDGSNNSSGGSGDSSAVTGTSGGGSAGGAEEPQTTQSGPAAFADATIGGPTNVTVGEEFELPVSVANKGGQNGTYSGTLTVAEGSSSFNRSVTIEGVEPGSTANSTVGPLNISSADNYTLAIEGTNSTHTVRVSPLEKQPGKAITANNLKIAVQGISLTPALFYSVDMGAWTDETGAELLSAGSGKILCLIQLSLENVGTNQASFTIPNGGQNSLSGSSNGSAAMLTLPKGKFYTSLPDGVSLSQLKGAKGKPLANATLSAGQSTNGWLVAQLPRSAATKTVQVGYQGDTKGTPPEAVWPFSPQQGSTRSLPKFSLQTFNVPKKIPIGSNASYTIGVKNTGDGPGIFRGVTELNSPSSNNFVPYNSQKGKIAPGDSKTFKQPISVSEPELGEGQLRLLPFGKTASFTLSTNKLSLGQTFKGPNGRNITVSDVQQADSYLTNDNSEPTTPDTSQHYIFARLGVKFVSKDAGSVNTSDFNLVSGGSTYDPFVEYDERFVKPVQADSLWGDLTGPKGSAKSGYIAYSVPKSVTPSNSKIVWSSDTPWAQWK